MGISASNLRNKLKPWMLPISMAGGIIFHSYIHYLQPLAPYLIFIMLLITFCKVKPNEFRVTGLSWSLLSVQILGSLIVYFYLLPFDKYLAIGGFILLPRLRLLRECSVEVFPVWLHIRLSVISHVRCLLRCFSH